MGKLTVLLLLTFLLTNSYSQITRENWLVGGNGSFTVFKVRDEKSRYLQLSPNIGYFFIDKLAAGLKLSYEYNKLGISGFSAKKGGFYLVHLRDTIF